MEEFRRVDEYSNYFVSNTGRIINSSGHEKALRKDNRGYSTVRLYKDGDRYTRRVHRLVAEAFIPNPDDKPEVNHKDDIKTNNSIDNLEWATRSENMLHAHRTGLVKPHPTYGMLGKKNPNGGRKGKPVRIVETGEEFDSIAECAEFIDGSDRAICECLKGRQHTHRDYHYEYI